MPSAIYTKAQFEQDLQRAVEDNTVTGAAVYAVDKHGRTLMSQCFGKSDVGGNSAPDFTMDTTFWMASTTKMLTSLSALQLVERGLLSLDEPVGRILPELADPDIMTGYDEAKGQITVKKATKKITLRHLLTHSSGIVYDNGFNALAIQYREVNGMSVPAKNDAPLPDAHVRALLFEPGESWEYGLGIDWAGLMVERVTSKTLGQYFDENVFGPLGIKNIAFNAVKHPHILKQLHGRVMRGPTGKMIRMEGSLFAPELEAYDAGGSGLYGSAGDYGKVLKSLITGDEKLIKNSTLKDLKKGCLSDGARARLNELVKDKFWGPGIAVGLPKRDGNVVYDYSLIGGLMTTKIEGECEAGMLYWGGLPNNNWYIDLDRGVAGYWGTWLLPIGDRITGDLFSKFRQAMYDEAGRSVASKL